MLDFDLAQIYGVTTKRLNEQFRRNAERFPDDFAFQLAHQEFANLRSQIATSSLHGGLRHLPIVFTEHGALMLASVLNSPIAVEASVRVVRAFVWMREQSGRAQGIRTEIEANWKAASAAMTNPFTNLFEAIRQLVEPPLPEDRQRIGFHVRETAPPISRQKLSKEILIFHAQHARHTPANQVGQEHRPNHQGDADGGGGQDAQGAAGRAGRAAVRGVDERRCWRRRRRARRPSNIRSWKRARSGNAPSSWSAPTAVCAAR